MSPDEDPKLGNFIRLQLIPGQKPCFPGPTQPARQKVNIHYYQLTTMSADVVEELIRSAKYKVVVIKRPFAQESVCFIS